ncbi:hypothetical protein TKK_0009818 [Trichogramma kaykai]|uniref:RING-type E3 ubiquitin transferase n=1 Tax=Trichogramma kaykai TaxID=54128 RepID=A0ABD2X260_9HYME
MRAAGVVLISVALTCAVVGNAYYHKKQFYPSVVYITKSNPSMAIIYVQGLILVLMANTFLRKIFFGNLRAAEFEHLMEKLWYAVTETCLAFTVFRDDFSPKFVVLFTLLLFLKSFHWLAEDRVDFMERSPVITWLFHIRVASLLALLFSINLAMFNYAYNSTIAKGPSVQLVFGFEYALLITVVLNINIKYILHTIDLQRDSPWDNKPVYMLYTELIIGLMKVTLYIAFVAIMVRIYTLPLFAFRPMYFTMRNFKKAFHDIVMSRRAIRNMNTLYPNATPEELAAADNVCIICREEMVSASKKLPCNHIFHTSCLRSWFQRQQTCPTCRLNILRPTTTSQPSRQQQNQQPPPAPAAANPPPQSTPTPGAATQQAAPPPQFQIPTYWAHLTTPPTSQGLGNQQGQNSSTSQLPSGIVTGVPVFTHSFQPIIPLPPVPTPPPNLSNLTEEELRSMEGNLRAAVEARIETLQRVQLLLDAATAMMSQYQTAARSASINLPKSDTLLSQDDNKSTTSSMDNNRDSSSCISDFSMPSSTNGIADLRTSEVNEQLTPDSSSLLYSDRILRNNSLSSTPTPTPSTSSTGGIAPGELENLRQRRLVRDQSVD